MKPHPTPSPTQLALCLYRLAHGCTFLTVGDLFGVAESTAHIIFHDVCKAIVGCLYDRLVYLPRNLQEWSQELENFLANWEFPCVGAWDLPAPARAFSLTPCLPIALCAKKKIRKACGGGSPRPLVKLCTIGSGWI